MSFTPSDTSQPSPQSPASELPPPDLADRLKDLRDRLSSESEKKQFDAFKDLDALGDAAIEVLMDFLSKRSDLPPTFLDGMAYQRLARFDREDTQTFLTTTFPDGLVTLTSDRAIDYRPLQDLLVLGEYEDADRVTLQKMCELAGDAAVRRKWLYFTEVNNFPIADLQAIDTLWTVYSEGKFGFSVQRTLWLSVGQDWNRLWPKIGWRSASGWTRYPNEFIWDLSAPRGHLPLTNQLRGVRVMESLMKHPAWTN